MSKPKIIARLEVKETAGMRRFLYPLAFNVEGTLDGQRLRVAELDGALVPSQTQSSSDSDHNVLFAVSLAPFETRQLVIVETDELPDIPDPISCLPAASGGYEFKQARFAHQINGEGKLSSVVYAGAEHLSGLATIELNDAEAKYVQRADPTVTGLVGDGIGCALTLIGAHGSADKATPCLTKYSMTSCKSWIKVSHSIMDSIPADARLVFTLPTPLAGTTTCDFGVGNGLYGKLQPNSIERLVWHSEIGDAVDWWLGSCALDSPTVRIDVQGTATSDDFASRSWFHVNARDKALAVAFQVEPATCIRIVVGIDTDGLVKLAFTPSAGQTTFRATVWWHFLDDIPPIAAATNPASILLPPSVTVLPA